MSDWLERWDYSWNDPITTHTIGDYTLEVSPYGYAGHGIVPGQFAYRVVFENRYRPFAFNSHARGL